MGEREKTTRRIRTLKQKEKRLERESKKRNVTIRGAK